MAARFVTLSLVTKPAGIAPKQCRGDKTCGNTAYGIISWDMRRSVTDNQTAQEERRRLGQSTDAPSSKGPQPTTPEPRPLHP